MVPPAHTGWWYSDILLSGHLKPQVDGTHGPHWLRNAQCNGLPDPPRPDRKTADRIEIAIRNDCFSVGSPEFCGTISTEQRLSDASLAFYSSGKRI